MTAVQGKHYISTGAKSKFYTLRYCFQEVVYQKSGGSVTGSFPVLRDYHLRNLGTDKDRAMQLAKMITGEDLAAEFEVGQIGRRDRIDWSILRFGQYANKSIHEVREIDPDYLCFVAENLDSPRHEKTIDLIKALMRHELDGRETLRRRNELAQQDRCRRVASIVKRFGEDLPDGKGRFADSIAQSFTEGHLPSERVCNIAIDILARKAGIRGSKDFCERKDQLSQIIAAAQGVLVLPESQLHWEKIEEVCERLNLEVLNSATETCEQVYALVRKSDPEQAKVTPGFGSLVELEDYCSTKENRLEMEEDQSESFECALR